MASLHRPGRVMSAVLVGCLMLLATGFGSSGSSGSSRPPVHNGAISTLNWWGEYGDVWPDSLDPAVGTNSLAVFTQDLVDANLVKFSYPSLKVIGDLAGHWSVSNRGRTYTFYLRPNDRFSNGDRVTAQDVVWSLTRALAPATKSPVAMTYLNHIVGASAVAAGKAVSLAGLKAMSATTVRFTLDKPIVYFLEALAYNTGDILDPRVLRGKPAGTYLTNTCRANVGPGPFRFVCRNGSSNRNSFYPSGHSPYMDMEPNPYYYGPKPKIRIHAPTFATSDNVFKAYQAGELDGATLPSADLGVARGMKGFMNVPQFVTDFMTPNAQIPPFNNVHCRLAVAYAIDRENITRKLLHSAESPLYDMLPPGILGYFGRESDVPFYHPARAKQELARCPGRLGNVTMTVSNANSDTIHEYDAVRANLQAIGANITIKPLNFNAWVKVVTQNMNVTRDQERITEALWIDDYPDPQDWCTNLLRSGSNYDIGGFKSAQYDSLVDRADVESNPARRARLYQAAQKIALRGGYWISVGAQNGLYVISPRVHGFVASNGWTWPINNDWSKISISRT